MLRGIWRGHEADPISPPYGALNTATGEMARPFADYLSACGKSLGLRGSTLSYAEYCGFQSVNGVCGTAKGEKGNVFIVRILTPPYGDGLLNEFNRLPHHKPGPGGIASLDPQPSSNT